MRRRGREERRYEDIKTNIRSLNYCRFFFFCFIIQRKGIICLIFKSYRLSSNRDRLLSRVNNECVRKLIWREIWIGLHRISARSFHSSTSHDSIGLRVNNSAFDIKITRWRDIIGPFVDHGQGHSLPSRGNSFWFRLTTELFLQVSPIKSSDDQVIYTTIVLYFVKPIFIFLITCLCFYY